MAGGGRVHDHAAARAARPARSSRETRYQSFPSVISSRQPGAASRKRWKRRVADDRARDQPHAELQLEVLLERFHRLDAQARTGARPPARARGSRPRPARAADPASSSCSASESPSSTTTVRTPAPRRQHAQRRGDAGLARSALARHEQEPAREELTRAIPSRAALKRAPLDTDEERCGRGSPMIVQCESCETRFHVADARIPEKGARVRCSRCHHRFHITPSSAASSRPEPLRPMVARGSRRSGERGAASDDAARQPRVPVRRPDRSRPPPARSQTPPRRRPRPSSEAADSGGRSRAQSRRPSRKRREPAEPPDRRQPAAGPRGAGGRDRRRRPRRRCSTPARPKLGTRQGRVRRRAARQPDSARTTTRSRLFLGDDAAAARARDAPSLRPAKDKPAKPARKPSAKPSPTPAKDAKFKDIDAAFGAGAVRRGRRATRAGSR